MSTPTHDCLSCVDGMAPTTSSLLGACYRECPTCRPVCGCCRGEGRFPYWTLDLAEFLDSYNTVGLLPILCHTCLGVLGVAQMNEEVPHDQS